MYSHSDKKKDTPAHEPQSWAAAQRKPEGERTSAVPDRTGLPQGLKAGLEALSGLSMGDVRVHYGSTKPAQLQAHAFAQGTHIHVAPGQERYLPHEAWHVVQQKQGRVPATRHAAGGTPVNDDAHLEHEADLMGAKALQTAGNAHTVAQARHIPFAVAQLGRKSKKGEQKEEKDPEPTAEEIELLLLQKQSEGNLELSAGEEERVLRFLRAADGSSSETRRIKTRLRQFMLAEDGDLSKLLNGGRAPKAPKKARRKAKDKQKAWEKVNLFDDEESDLSENEEVPLGYLRGNYPNTFKPVTDHSRADKEEGEFMDASNTNLLLFQDGSLIPRTINGKPNTDAKRKRKRSLSQKLQDEQEELRAKQESVYFGSHLPTDQQGKLVTNDVIKRVKRETDKGKNPALHRLLNYTLPGFAQKDSHTHGEQSVLRSRIWDNLVQKLVSHLQGLVGRGVEEADEDDVTTIQMVLNRSSCIECARSMSVALLVFWEQVAAAMEFGSAQEAREALGDYVRFVARFPTVYEHDKERGKEFKNLDAVLGGLMEAGWLVLPFKPAIEGGLDSHNDLVDRVRRAKGGEEDAEGFDDSLSIYNDEEDEEYSESDDEEDDYRLLRANNCLLVAMNNGHAIDEDVLTIIRGELFEEGHADYAEFVEANAATVSIIAEQLGITQTIIHVTHMEHDGEAIFVIDEAGHVTELEEEEDRDNIDSNVAYNAYGYILIDYAGNHFEKRR